MNKHSTTIKQFSVDRLVEMLSMGNDEASVSLEVEEEEEDETGRSIDVQEDSHFLL